LLTSTAVALRTAWRRVVHLWRPLAGWTLLVWATVAGILAPLTSAVLGWHVLRADRLVIGNEELLTPVGILFLVIAASVTLTGAVVRYAGFFTIVTDELKGHRPTVRRTAFLLAPKVPLLFKLALVTVGGAFLLLLPLAGALGLVYLALLGEHDINFYLYTQPPEWHRALWVGGVIAAIWAMGAAYVAGRSVMALPAYLDGHRPITRALRESWSLAEGRTVRLLRLVGLAVGAWLLTRVVMDATFLAAASLTVDAVASVTASLATVAAVTGLFLAASFALDAVIGFFGFAFVSTVITKFYHEDTHLHAEAPRLPTVRSFPRKARRRLGHWLRPSRLAVLAVLPVAGAVLASSVVLSRLPEPRPVSIHAHRAGPPPAPENTMAALEAAIEAGADYTEIDVQRTRDGTLVIAHDADFMRVAGDPRRIAEVDYADIAHLVQHPDDGSPPEERLIATLGDFLERSRGRIGLNIELKYYGWDPGLAPAVVDEVRAHGMEGDVVLMSLTLPAVRQLLRLAPDMPVGYLPTVAVGDPARLPVDFLAVPRSGASPRLIRAAHQRGMEVYVWTINDAAVMADMIERGVDGLITDDPALAAQVREEMAALPPAARLLLRFRPALVGTGDAELRGEME
jgi:glycerophosphoryl diester phosphodiesterase